MADEKVLGPGLDESEIGAGLWQQSGVKRQGRWSHVECRVWCERR